MSKKFYADGATKNNGQFGCQRSYLSVLDDNEKILADEYIGDTTNNQAEVLAVLAALKHIARHKIKNAEILSDSQLIVKALNYEREIKSELLKYYLIHARHLLQSTESSISWVPREENKAGWFLERKYEKGWREYWPQPQEDYRSSLSGVTQNSISDFVRWLNRQSAVTKIDEYRVLVWWMRSARSNKKMKELQEVLDDTNEALKFIRSNPMKFYKS